MDTHLVEDIVRKLRSCINRIDARSGYMYSDFINQYNLSRFDTLCDMLIAVIPNLTRVLSRFYRNGDRYMIKLNSWNPFTITSKIPDFEISVGKYTISISSICDIFRSFIPYYSHMTYDCEEFASGSSVFNIFTGFQSSI